MSAPPDPILAVWVQQTNGQYQVLDFPENLFHFSAAVMRDPERISIAMLPEKTRNA